METLDWLPPEPISLTHAQTYEQNNDHINDCWPLLGRYPEPFEEVILCMISIEPDERLWAAFDPEVGAWVVLVRATDPFAIGLVPKIATETRAYAEQFYDDESFATFAKGVPTNE